MRWCGGRRQAELHAAGIGPTLRGDILASAPDPARLAMHINARLVLAAALALAGATPALAQHVHGAHHPPAAASGAAAHGPYAGLQGRSIKALSEQQVADL